MIRRLAGSVSSASRRGTTPGPGVLPGNSSIAIPSRRLGALALGFLVASAPFLQAQSAQTNPNSETWLEQLESGALTEEAENNADRKLSGMNRKLGLFRAEMKRRATALAAKAKKSPVTANVVAGVDSLDLEMKDDLSGMADVVENTSEAEDQKLHRQLGPSTDEAKAWEQKTREKIDNASAVTATPTTAKFPARILRPPNAFRSICSNAPFHTTPTISTSAAPVP